MSDHNADDEIIVRLPESAAGQRLDRALADLLPDYSRSRLKQWLTEGTLTVDDGSPAPKTAVAGGELVHLRVPVTSHDETLAPEPIALNIIYEDADIIVLDKPAGLVMHPGAGNPDGTLANALLAHDPALAALPRAGIVHRLDKDTSGILVVARTFAAHKQLVADLAERTVKREYEAVSVGVMTAGGHVDAPIDRHPMDRKKMAVREEGRDAVTHYRVITRYRAHTHVRCQLETGRTHQIRVHMAHIRYPLLGDPVYGRRLALPKDSAPAFVDVLRGFRRQALHAARLGLTHPTTGDDMAWEAPRPADFQALLDALAADAADHAP
ncbi:23S rRNA pseudouridine(1911/1915/1917) synthase RluD [Salinisphaera sp. Q1T1-3]|uniref:23S rRNA pseudouridine(1911/1915/1917) synthase RluD n=1 Tax=Salinisphaera sp. Q1T1-3 TaxID=2321229 RepID=UPI000E73E612|nr:23S rRNA pseudouridine(1911/1915/1917) synthase RluD [Salinisphaera sp. Q1T1-3]RJS92269.1 23S rRNA pseudouridine(1911/1915/1917) synthase RluD [Salinisphaera sp. Q1T1-3]